MSFLKKTPLYATSTALMGKSVVEYWFHYFSSRSFPKDQEFYVVYTNLDQDIPFQPDGAIDYWLINSRLIPVSLKLGVETSGELFRNIRHAYVSNVKEACAAFREVPTIMPHFTGHRVRALRTAQTLLKPINCSPSLHTTTPFFVYNLGAKYIPEKEPEMRRHVGDIISTIIKTKLHAIIDIAFGLFLAKRTIQDKLGLEFNDLEYFLTREQKEKDKIPYEQIYRIYREINALEEASAVKNNRLPDIMKRYFQELGLPQVKREQSACIYDLENKVLLRSPDLQVGRGFLWSYK